MAVIRPTRVSEVAALPAIEQSAGQAFLLLPDVAYVAEGELMSVDEHTRLAALGSSWVALNASGPVGFLAAEVMNEPAGSGSAAALHIWELSVHSQAQGQGIGAQLMRHAMACACNDLGCGSVTLTTFRDVAFNAPFYARLGFVELTQERLGERLKQVLAEEAAHGLRLEDRCAMRYLCAY